MRQHRDRPERGQGSLETVAIVLVAAIMVAATTGTIIQASPGIRGEVSYQLCRIINVFNGGGDCQSPEEQRAEEEAEERLPDEPCVVGSQQGSVEVTGSFVVSVTVGKQLLVEELSDGTFRVTEVDLGKVGVGVGPGIDVSITLDGKKYGAVASATAGALLAGKTGRTWYADDQGELEDIANGLIAKEVLDQVAPDLPGPADVPLVNKIPWVGDIEGPPNPTRLMLEQIIGKMPDPDEEFVEGGIEGNAAASASSIVYGAGGQVNVSGYLGGKSTPDGYVAYYKGSVSGSVFATFTGLDASAGAGAEVLYEVNMGTDGEVESVSITSAYTLAADAGDLGSNTDDQKYVQTKMTVPLTGDFSEDAQIMAALTGNPVSLMDFAERAREDGTIARNTYSQDPNTYGFNATGELLGDYGASASVDFTDRELTDAEYWDGTQMAARPDCET